MTEGTNTRDYVSQDIFVVELETAAGMTSNVIDSRIYNFPFRVISAVCVKTGAGAAGDTIKLQKKVGATVTDISDAVDTSAKADKTIYAFGTFDDAQMDINNGGQLRLLTVSDDLSRVTVTCMKMQATP